MWTSNQRLSHLSLWVSVAAAAAEQLHKGEDGGDDMWPERKGALFAGMLEGSLSQGMVGFSVDMWLSDLPKWFEGG